MDSMPVFPSAKQETRGWILRVTGLIRRKLELSLYDLMKLKPVSITLDFECLEGWVVPGTVWQGVKASTVISLAHPLSTANYAVFKSGNYTESFPIDRMDELVIAYHLYGKPIPSENGGPLRLVFTNQACYQSIKWLEEIELTDKPVQGTARDIALSRLR